MRHVQALSGKIRHFHCSGKIRHFQANRGHVFWETAGGILFREYCFGEENSLSLTEFGGKLGEFCEKLGEFDLAHKE